MIVFFFSNLSNFLHVRAPFCCISCSQFKKNKNKNRINANTVLGDLFNQVSLSYVLPFSHTKVTLKLTGGVSNSFTP